MNRAILEERIAARNKLVGPQIGDVVNKDGITYRIAAVWVGKNPAIQLTSGGSFYLSDFGTAGYSGGTGSWIINGEFP